MTKRTNEGFSLAKPMYTDRRGKKCVSAKYHLRIKDHAGIWRRLPAFSDKGASESFARKIRQLADLRTVGEPLRGELAVWVNDLPDDVRDKLIEFDILDKRLALAALPLTEHIEVWTEHMQSKGRSQNHVDLFIARVNKIVKGCGYKKFRDIDELHVQEWIKANTHSLQTANHYKAALKAFCLWMIKRERAISYPLKTMEMDDVKVDRKRVRRALSLDELRLLIQTANDGPVRGRNTGQERSLIYQTAIETGFRLSELRSLRAMDFDLLSLPPTVRIQAKNAKNNEEVKLAVTNELATQMRVHLANKLPSAQALAVPTLGAKMLRYDLKRAGIEYQDANGEYYDFHSLRCQTATNLARAGVHPSVTQKRMRHSDINLTMNVYTKVSSEDDAKAVAAMPKLSAS